MEKEEIQSILEDYYPYINEFLGEIIEQRLTSPNYEDSILISRLLEAPRRLATLKEDEQVEDEDFDDEYFGDDDYEDEYVEPRKKRFRLDSNGIDVILFYPERRQAASAF